MILAKLIFKLIVLAALGLFGIHLLKNNRVVATNLLKSPGIFATREIKDPQNTPITAHKLILARVMMYIVGLSFVLAAVIGAVIKLKEFFQ
jgi:hypothetical protein